MGIRGPAQFNPGSSRNNSGPENLGGDAQFNLYTLSCVAAFIEIVCDERISTIFIFFKWKYILRHFGVPFPSQLLYLKHTFLTVSGPGGKSILTTTKKNTPLMDVGVRGERGVRGGGGGC